MKYKTALEIYDEEVASKQLTVPVAAMSAKEKTYFDVLANAITSKADDLNFNSPFWQFFMFGTRRDYKTDVKEFKEFLDFWAFDIETIKSGKFCRLDGET